MARGNAPIYAITEGSVESAGSDGSVTVSAEPDADGFVGSAPKGLWRLATGGAQRNPWTRSAPPQVFVLKGRRHAALVPSGRCDEAIRIPPTGFAALHPWLCACAPPERNARAPDAGTADGTPPNLSRTLLGSPGCHSPTVAFPAKGPCYSMRVSDRRYCWE